MGALPNPTFLFTEHDSGGEQDGLGWGEEERSELVKIVELLELADQYLLHHLKQKVELLLARGIRTETSEWLLETSDRCNATQLHELVKHFRRQKMLKATD